MEKRAVKIKYVNMFPHHLPPKKTNQVERFNLRRSSRQKGIERLSSKQQA